MQLIAHLLWTRSLSLGSREDVSRLCVVCVVAHPRAANGRRFCPFIPPAHPRRQLPLVFSSVMAMGARREAVPRRLPRSPPTQAVRPLWRLSVSSYPQAVACLQTNSIIIHPRRCRTTQTAGLLLLAWEAARYPGPACQLHVDAALASVFPIPLRDVCALKHAPAFATPPPGTPPCPASTDGRVHCWPADWTGQVAASTWSTQQHLLRL